MDPFPLGAFNEKISKKKRIPPVVYREDDGNGIRFVYELVKHLDCKHRIFSLKKIKSMLKSMVQPIHGEKRTLEDTIKIFDNNMIFWKKGQLPLEKDYKRLSWFVPFIPNEYFFLYTADLILAYDYLLDSILNLRARILDYVRYYYSVSELPVY
jgi:hypothetical protein